MKILYLITKPEEDGSELKINIAWKDDFLHFRSLKNGEETL